MRLTVCWILLAILSHATDKFDVYFAEAGEAFNVSPILLKNIAKIESGLNSNAIRKNKNGTFDYGLMQINSIHLKKYSRHYGMTEKQLMDPKINIFVAAKLISSIIRKHGFNFESIGRYHSNTPQIKAKWNRKLVEEIKQSITTQKGKSKC